MATDILRVTGTSVAWQTTGGDYVLTLGGLANTSARQGAKGDLGATRADLYSARLTWKENAAPSNGAPVEVYWSSSTSATAATDNTGGASGSDGFYTGTGGGLIAATKLQLLLVGIAPCTADTGGVTQVCEWSFSPPQRYGMPVVVNSSGQAFTTGNFSLVLVPLKAQSQ